MLNKNNFENFSQNLKSFFLAKVIKSATDKELNDFAACINEAIPTLKKEVKLTKKYLSKCRD